MEKQNEIMASIMATIEHLMVSKGIQEFKACETLQSVGSEEILRYITPREGDYELCTIEDKTTEMKISTCLLIYLHEKQPENSRDMNERLCQGVINSMRAIKLQSWYVSGHIEEAQYNQLRNKQKKAELFAEAKYRVKTTLAGTAVGALTGSVIIAKLAKIGIVLDPQTAAIIIGGSTLIGLLLGLFLPPEKIEELKKWARKQIMPKLKDALQSKLKAATDNIPAELEEMGNKLLDSFKKNYQQKNKSSHRKSEEEKEQELEQEIN